MAELHELLAVESDLKVTAKVAATALKALFTAGVGRFEGLSRTYTPMEEDGETFPAEIVVRGTTVLDELGTYEEVATRWFDCVAQIAASNQSAKADLVIYSDPGEAYVLLENVPAITLLDLEAKLGALYNLYASIPTVDPTKVWTLDKGRGALVSAPETRFRTKKLLRWQEISPATVKHPAQIETWNEDVRVGTWTATTETGMMTVAEKKQILARIATLLEAAKKARQRANKQEVVRTNVGHVLFEYIMG